MKLNEWSNRFRTQWRAVGESNGATVPGIQGRRPHFRGNYCYVTSDPQLEAVKKEVW